MRIQVNLNDEMVNRVDKIAKDYGVSRSALCSMYIGQMVDNTEVSKKAVNTLLSNKDILEMFATENK